MSIQKNPGILLRRQELRETSLILTFFTRDFGKIKGVLRGVRGSRSAFGQAAFEPFALDEIVFYERRGRDVFTISQCDLADYFITIRSSLERLSYAAYMTELLDSITGLSDQNPGIFELTLNSLRLLSGSTSPRRVARIYEIKLMNLQGLMPNLESCVVCGNGTGHNPRFSLRNGGLVCSKCLNADRMAVSILPGTVKYMEHVRNSDFERAASVKVAQEVGKELEKLLRNYLDYHIERRLNTLKFINDIGQEMI